MKVWQTRPCYLSLCRFQTNLHQCSICAKDGMYDKIDQIKLMNERTSMDVLVQQAERKLIIYPQRSSLHQWLVIYWGMGTIVLFLLIVLLYLFFLLFQIMPPFLFVGAIFMYLFLLSIYGFILFILPSSLWPIVPITQCWWSLQPVLTIDEQGLTIYQQPMLKSVFLPWAEIAMLSIVKAPFHSGAFIYLYPKNRNRYVLCPRGRQLLQSWLNITHRHMFFHGPWFLSLSATEFISQIQETFGEELRKYELQIQTTVSRPVNRYTSTN